MGRIYIALSLILSSVPHFFLMPFVCEGASSSAQMQVLSFSSLVPLVEMGHRHLETAEMVGRRDCKPVDPCEMCTFSDQKSIPSCKETGRKQKMECTAFDGDESKTISDFYSCKYTDADNQFAMIRLQMICVVVGSMAFMSVRRQQRANASLFDQRKLAAEAARLKAKRARRSSEYVESHQDEEIEFTNTHLEETVPLVDTSSNPLEII